MRIFNGLIFLILSVITQKAWAETIQLKDGTIVKGSIASMDEQFVVVDTADMGRVTIKRRTIQSIRDGSEQSVGSKTETPQSVNININNQQTNDQKNDQKNEQTNEQKVEQSVGVQETKGGDKKLKDRSWEQGLFGRLLFGAQKVKISGAPESNSTLNAEKNSFAMDWDVIGFRSASWWAVSLFMNGGTLDRPSNDSSRVPTVGKKELRKNVFGLGLRIAANIFRTNHGRKALSQFYVGPSIASQELEIKPEGEKKTEIFTFKASGTRVGIDVGYEYLLGENFGFALGLSGGQAELGTFKFGDTATAEGYSPIDFDKKKQK